MFSLEKIVRENIKNLQPYSSARDDFLGDDGVFLDANENPFGTLNRYPDPQQRSVKQRLSTLKSVSKEQIFIGNGSDEIIDLIYRIFCEPKRDKVLMFTPTYGMYDVSAAINNVEVVKTHFTTDFQIDFDVLNNELIDDSIKLLFICSPNNPTGNNITEIERVLQMFNGIVVVDEAYIDFTTTNSMIEKIKEYPNLIVMQTFSKAWGLAGARIGAAYASVEIIEFINKVKPPYNVSALSQQAVLTALDQIDEYESQKTIILEQREWLVKQIQKISLVKKIYPSETNFLLVEMYDANRTYYELVQQKVITRNRNKVVNNCIRITVGSEKENQLLIESLKNIEQ